MKPITSQDLDLIAGNSRYPNRKSAFLAGLTRWSRPIPKFELALVLAQVMVESGRFRYVKEIWGPTAAQRRYEGREDLGNVRPGDGKRFMGRDLIQVTGRYNYRALTRWVREETNLFKCPDFERNPDLLIEPEWLGISVQWYWKTRIKRRHVLSGDVENISRAVNGGRNGLTERFNYYTRAALVLLGYAPDDVSGFQGNVGITVDGIPGPHTRAALHRALVSLEPIRKPPPKPNVGAAPARSVDRAAIGIVAALLAGLGVWGTGVVCNWPWLTGLFGLACGGGQ